MLQLIAKGDRAAGALARAATTLGQCALVVLGVHLAADNLDDGVLAAATAVTGWLDAHLAAPLGRAAGWLSLPPDALTLWDRVPLGPLAGWTALLVEALAALLLWGSFVLSARQDRPSWHRYRRAASVGAVVMPLSLAGVLLAGAWSMAMGVEDLLPAHAVAPWAAGMVGLVALLHYGVPAWRRAVAALEPRRRWTDGLAPALVLAPVGLLAWVHGVPVWGLLRGVLP